MKSIRAADVFVAVDMKREHFRRILTGCRDFLNQSQAAWQLMDKWAPVTEDLGENHFDGAIIQGTQGKAVSTLIRQGVPIVQVSGQKAPDPKTVTVLPDNQAIGRVAAEHFLSRGFLLFAFVGEREHWYSQERRKGFEASLGERKCHAWTDTYASRHGQRGYMNWLKQLPHSTALFCANDIYARTAIRILVEMGRKVPEDIAVVGVDNDEVESSLCSVPLSSVDPRSKHQGLAAAAELDRMMNGQTPVQKLTLIPPGEVRVRASSDILNIKDPTMASALVLIRDFACDGLRVEELLEKVAVSRRTLERRFKDTLERGVESEIRRVRMEQSRSLLASTNLAIGAVAHRSGFSDIYYFPPCLRKSTV